MNIIKKMIEITITKKKDPFDPDFDPDRLKYGQAIMVHKDGTREIYDLRKGLAYRKIQ